MKIDASKMNLSEKDIEDWLYENPEAVTTYSGEICYWIGRQYRLPSGIADLIGATYQNLVVVVEIKNVAINKAAVLQVCRYAADLQEVLSQRDKYTHVRPSGEPIIGKILIGPSIDDQTFNEARACDVSYMQFQIDLNLNLNSYGWSKEYRERMGEQAREISYRKEWERFGPHVDEILEQMAAKEEEERYGQEYQKTIAGAQEQDEYDKLMNAAAQASIQDDEEEEDPF